MESKDDVLVIDSPSLDDATIVSATTNLDLCWTNGDIRVSASLIHASGLLSQTLQFDPSCTRIDMTSLGLCEPRSIAVARLVFDLQTTLQTHCTTNVDYTKVIHLQKCLLHEKVSVQVDDITIQPGLLRECVDFSRILLLEPVHTVLDVWLARVLCGLNLKTVEQWIDVWPGAEKKPTKAPFVKCAALLKNDSTRPLSLQSCSAATKKKALEIVKKPAVTSYKELPIF